MYDEKMDRIRKYAVNGDLKGVRSSLITIIDDDLSLKKFKEGCELAERILKTNNLSLYEENNPELDTYENKPKDERIKYHKITLAHNFSLQRIQMLYSCRREPQPPTGPDGHSGYSNGYSIGHSGDAGHDVNKERDTKRIEFSPDSVIENLTHYIINQNWEDAYRLASDSIRSDIFVPHRETKVIDYYFDHADWVINHSIVGYFNNEKTIVFQYRMYLDSLSLNLSQKRMEKLVGYLSTTLKCVSKKQKHRDY